MRAFLNNHPFIAHCVAMVPMLSLAIVAYVVLSLVGYPGACG